MDFVLFHRNYDVVYNNELQVPNSVAINKRYFFCHEYDFYFIE